MTMSPAVRPRGRGIRGVVVPFGLLVSLLAAIGGVLAQDQRTPVGAPPRYRMPSITPNEYLVAEAESIHAITRSLEGKSGDRAAIYAGFRAYLDQHARFAERVTKHYPKNQLEWLLVTDYAADTLAADLASVVDRYAKARPDEILTEGRQLLEVNLVDLPPTPDRMLGLHVLMLGNFVAARSDSLLRRNQTKDRAGVEDGALRWVQDWTQLYEFAHRDPTERHISHLKHEDWVVVRLADNCGNQGADVWELKGLMMAMVGVDSTKTPPIEQYAHEFHLAATKCPGDERYVYYDLPYLQESLMEAGRRARAREEQAKEEAQRERDGRRN